MAEFKKIPYYSLRAEALVGTLPTLVGRAEEQERLTRVINRRINNNALIVGPSGIGKTTLVYGWLKRLSEQENYVPLQFIQFDADHLYGIDDAGVGRIYREALGTLPPCVLFIDNFGRAIRQSSSVVHQMMRLYDMTFKKPDVRVVIALQPHEYAWLEREHPAFVQLFETIPIKQQTPAEYVRILETALPRLNHEHNIIIPTSSLQEIVSYVERFPSLGQLPRSAISLLDESIAFAAATGRKELMGDGVAQVVASKTGIPINQLNPDELEVLKRLEETLNQRVIHQSGAITKIAKTLQRAKLGIRNPQKPLGSFLMLGPSGVGKTETAKMIAEIMFGRSESFIRFDMSEFAQDHTVQRLIGSPAGYTGYEEGGALTNALRAEPHCIILLDEIEKAHPKIFDIFLQVLDDGRLTSGQNETVDACNAIVMATSNVGVEEILKGAAAGADMNDPEFIREKILPLLAETFRLEFLNRFDSILIFNPLTLPGLVQIAQLEMKKIEKRLAKHHVQFTIDPAVLEEKIKTMTDPRFGARPVKRFIEETCESLLVQSLLK
jgi:ATP-dependent Clp protease ATP-binding subunit ClpA